MACSFPIYSDITGAEIIGVVYPRASIGRYNETMIDAENTSSQSIVGRAITYFNKLAVDNSVDFSALSDDECAKLRMSLRWYIAGKYRENDLELEGCPDCYKTDELVCRAYEQACNFMKLVSTSIANNSTFCKWKSTQYALTGFFGAESHRPCGCE